MRRVTCAKVFVARPQTVHESVHSLDFFLGAPQYFNPDLLVPEITKKKRSNLSTCKKWWNISPHAFHFNRCGCSA